MTATRTKRVWIAIAIVVGGLIIVNLVAQGLDRAVGGSEPSGVPGSSYATIPDGLAAFATLLADYGHGINRQRGSITANPPAPDATVFLLEPGALTKADATALMQFARAGGRLVVGDQSPSYLHNLSDDPPKWQSAGTTTWTEIDPALGAVRVVDATGIGAWTSSGRGRPLVGTENESLLTEERLGLGEILFLADPSPLQNAYLGRSDNAAFGIALAGDASRPVVFAEGVHGYGTSRGLAALPDRWKVALLLVVFAAAVFVWSRARRFGPPDRNARDLPPARAEYVTALSLSLERAPDHIHAFVPAQRWARTRVAARSGLDAHPNTDDEELTRAARSLGCPDEEIAALCTAITDDASVLALGRLISRLGGNGRIS